MGTNYYLRENECPHCGRYDERHIGKSSGGWTFALHVYPDEGINTLDDWKAILDGSDGSIYDEYGESVCFALMLGHITKREWKHRNTDDDRTISSYAVKGPNGLCRHKIDGRHCVGYGEGTWDYIIGEFS